MHCDDPETLQHPGLASLYDPDAVSCIPVPMRYYAPEPAYDSIPTRCENDYEFPTHISQS